MNQQQFERLRAQRRPARAAALFSSPDEQRMLRRLADQARLRQRLLNAIGQAARWPAGLEDCDFELAGTRLRIMAGSAECLRRLGARRETIRRAVRQAGFGVRALELGLRRGGGR